MLSHAAQYMRQQDPNPNTVTARCTSINSRDGSDPRRPKKGSLSGGGKRGGSSQELISTFWKPGASDAGDVEADKITGGLKVCLAFL